MGTVATTCPIIDIDTHIAEPPDLWTSRVASKWQDGVPRVVHDPETGEDRWMIAGMFISAVGSSATAGWKEPLPSRPSWDEVDPGAWHPKSRIERMDEYGVDYQLVYPNLIGFHSQSFLLLEPELRMVCVRAYNDFLVEWAEASGSAKRLVPLMAVPFWDVEASVAEIERCAGMGHKGLLFSHHFDKVGLPRLEDEHWRPLLEAAQGLQMPINFHIGFNERSKQEFDAFVQHEKRRDYARASAMPFIANSHAIAEITMSRVCHNYPRLNFVSVESGYSWVPFLLESLDWQWLNSGVPVEEPDMMLPSEYFRRQVYTSFWFETESLRHTIELYPDNVMFETDYPHPTSLSPGPASTASRPRDMAAQLFEPLPDEVAEKALYRNAARIYNIDVAA